MTLRVADLVEQLRPRWPHEASQVLHACPQPTVAIAEPGPR
jgi:hypothetical protein